MDHKKHFLLTAFVLSAFMFLLPFNLFSDNRLSITGKVTDKSGEPIMGVSIIIKGSSQGTITDKDGKYKIENLESKSILNFSFIGMNPQSILVTNQKIINVILEDNIKNLDEIVVIGYGESKRSDLTGSLKGVKPDQLASQIQSAEQALIGRVSGVKVSQDFSPGGGLNIQVRGANSMSGGTQPLYVVDGFPLEPISDAQGNNSQGQSAVQSSMNFINPSDIEDIQILKDASATAIYGARGANGVVLITTKTGKAGKSKIEYNFSTNIGTVAHKIDLMNSQEWATVQNQKVLNKFYIESEAIRLGIWTGTPTSISIPYDGIKNPLPSNLPNTDWQDAIYRTSISQNHSIQLSGGTQDTKYSFGIGYLNQQGIVINSDFNRYTFNTNIEQKVTKKFTISNYLNFMRSFSNGVSTSTGDYASAQSIISTALHLQPNFTVNRNLNTPDDGNSYLNVTGYRLDNPVSQATLQTDFKVNSTATDALNLTYDCNKYLKLFAKLGVNYTTSERNQYWPRTLTRGEANNGIATISSQQTIKTLAEARINYNRTFNLHVFSLMGAFTYENNDFASKYDTYAGFPDDILGYKGANFATTNYPTQFGWSNTKLTSYIGRANYKYKDKYLLTATLRADGSTLFAENKKWGIFPSVAAGWRITQEDWIPKTELVTNLKLRASYGQTGSTGGISPYLSQGLQTSSFYSFNDIVVPGFYESNIKNPDLTWETTDQFNVGLDASLLNDHLMLTVDLYLKQTHDLLQWLTLPGSFGYTYKVVNMGAIENKGLEFELTVPILKTKNLNWKVSFNGTMNRNKLLSLGENTDYMMGPIVGYYRVNRFIVGQPLGVFWGLQNDGIFKNWTEAKASNIFNALPGEVRYVNNYIDYQTNSDGTYKLDASGNKIPAVGQVINEKDMTVIGDPNPKFNYGFNTSLQFKSFDISMIFTGQVGGQIYYADMNDEISQLVGLNMHKFIGEDAWIPPMVYQYNLNGQQITFGSATGNIDNATLPSAKNGGGTTIAGINQQYRGSTFMSSGILYDASFLKLTNITIGYSFILFKSQNKLKTSLGINNLFCITSYPGYDPESASFINSTTKKGIDLGSYPSQRTYNLSISLTL